jgi:hypothetical protein
VYSVVVLLVLVLVPVDVWVVDETVAVVDVLVVGAPGPMVKALALVTSVRFDAQLNPPPTKTVAALVRFARAASIVAVATSLESR